MISRQSVPMKEVPGPEGHRTYETDFGGRNRKASALYVARSAVKLERKRLNDLAANPLYIPLAFVEELMIGEFGHMTAFDLKVSQVVDESNVILTAFRPGAPPFAGTSIWVRGVPTNRLHDDIGVVTLDKPLYFVGTRQYDTPAGRRTILLADVIDYLEWIEVITR